MADTWDDVRKWRAKAEELLSQAADFGQAKPKEAWQRAAAVYSAMADEAEARLTLSQSCDAGPNTTS